MYLRSCRGQYMYTFVVFTNKIYIYCHEYRAWENTTKMSAFIHSRYICQMWMPVRRQNGQHTWDIVDRKVSVKCEVKRDVINLNRDLQVNLNWKPISSYEKHIEGIDETNNYPANISYRDIRRSLRFLSKTKTSNIGILTNFYQIKTAH